MNSSTSECVRKYLTENEEHLFSGKKVTPFYVFSDNAQNIKIYAAMQKNIVFIHHSREFDSSGWIDKTGYSFKEKLDYLGADTNGVWCKVDIGALNRIYRSYTVISPVEFGFIMSRIIKPAKYYNNIGAQI